MRLDRLLVSLGEFDSRQKAQEAIKAGRITINNLVIQKPSYEIDERSLARVAESSTYTPLKCGLDSNRESSLDSGLGSGLDSAALGIAIAGRGFVSRAGEKLQGFLEQCERRGIAKAWQSAIDVGAARGGFTQVLLAHGVAHVTCVDVGSGQLHEKIANDPRVACFENCDIREFAPRCVQRFDVAVCDVSFISLEHIFSALSRLSDELVLLFKPQFEVGRAVKRNRRGVVQDSGAIEAALKARVEWISAQGFSVRLLAESIIKGKEGNAEFFIYACRESRA